MKDMSPEEFAADTTPVKEEAPTPTDWTEPGMLGEGPDEQPFDTESDDADQVEVEE